MLNHYCCYWPIIPVLNNTCGDVLYSDIVKQSLGWFSRVAAINMSAAAAATSGVGVTAGHLQ